MYISITVLRVTRHTQTLACCVYDVHACGVCLSGACVSVWVFSYLITVDNSGLLRTLYIRISLQHQACQVLKCKLNITSIRGGLEWVTVCCGVST